MCKLGHYHFYRKTRYGRLPSYPQATIKSNDKLSALLATLFYLGEDGVLHDCLGASLSDDVRPEIRDFISKSLMSPHQPIIQKSDLSDDDLALLHPNENESVEMYRGRVEEFIKQFDKPDES